MKKIFLSAIGLLFTAVLFAQQPKSNAHRYANMPQQKIGVITGTVVDSITQHPIDGASIFVFSERRDTTTHLAKEMLVGSVVSQNDGSFEMGNLPVPGRLKLQVSVVGRETYQKMVLLTPANSSLEVGKVLIQQISTNLKTVTVTAASNSFMTVGVDKKVFSVANSIVSTGQTAQEVMAQIPSVSVDIDGNVTLRGSTPQIYVDGMPTTLTLDQIPSDLIDRVEVITNPSAKYDASDANSGIINIILKKNNTRGYNGGISAGTDTRNQYNISGDLNVRLSKWNLFGNAAYRRRNDYQTNSSTRDMYDPSGDSKVLNSTMKQGGSSNNPGHFIFLNLGATYNINKKNIATLQGRYVNGAFNSNQLQHIDSLFYDGTPSSYSYLNSISDRSFKNFQGDFRFQHNFSDDGNHNLLVDVNYNRATFNGPSYLDTRTFADADTTNLTNNVLSDILANGRSKNLVFQADYVNPISKNSKIEAGIRGQINNTNSLSMQYTDSTGMATDLISNEYLQTYASTKYSFTQSIYAAYGMFSSKLWEKLAYQVGLRVESSNYKGTQDSIPVSSNVSHSYKVKYPLSLFPSVNLTYNLTDAQDIQFSYSRKVQRPGFFQLLPNINYSDPYNLQKGNPNLLPQFTSMYELSYDNNYGHSNSFVAGIYYRHSTNLITGYTYVDSSLSGYPYMSSYLNTSTSNTYGLELIDKTTIAKIWDLIGNFNLYNTAINGIPTAISVINGIPTVMGVYATNQQMSWFAKITSTWRLPLGISFQVTGQYHSKTVLPNSGGNSSSSGNNNGRFGGGGLGSATGYIGANSEVDAALSKIWRFKQGNTLTFTASIRDIFGGAKYYSYSEADYNSDVNQYMMTQNTQRLRQPRIVRFTLSYRFGRMDMKKKQQQQQSDDNSDDMSGGMGGGM